MIGSDGENLRSVRAAIGALYTVAGISGPTDMDALTLSTARLVSNGRLDPASGWRAILFAALANLVFKVGIVAFLGSRRILARVALLFGAAVVGGGVILWVWP